MKVSLEVAQKARAADLKKSFSVFGHFYDRLFDDQFLPCREILEIVAQNNIPDDFQELSLRKPELIVVMMNPGSSQPAEREYSPKRLKYPKQIVDKRFLVETLPDIAQYQIMRFMLLNGWQHGRILNLSDLREPKSGVFMQRWPQLDISHSIFAPKRRKALKALLGAPKVVLLAWSQEKALLPLAERAEEALHGYKTIGLTRGDNLYAYPSPMLQKHKDAWLEGIAELL